MPILYDDRSLARLVQIDNITPIENADAIEAAKIGGWIVVVRKGEFRPGNFAVFFEIDTALPLDDPRFTFLGSRGTKKVDGREYHVLKTARLRGVYSQGLLLPTEEFPELLEWTVIDGDLTKHMGLGKYEKPLPMNSGAVGDFPTNIVQKTDSERAQNLSGGQWTVIQRHEWYATEKVDGSSCTVICNEDGQIIVCSRNWQLEEGDNVFWNAARTFTSHLSNNEVVQFEVVGPGIQDNRLGLSEVRPIVFDFHSHGQIIPRSEWPAWVTEHATPIVDLPFPDSAKHAIEQIEGLKSLVSPGRMAEGVVWHTTDGSKVDRLDRSTFKAINNRYLLK